MQRKDYLWRLMSVGPAFLLLLLLTFVPVVLLITMSFHDIKWEGGQAHWNFLGWTNYRELPSNAFYRAGLVNTYIFVVVTVIAEMLLGFAFALLVSRLTRGRMWFIAVFLLPILIPGIVIGAIWKLMYNFDFGLFNDMVGIIGIPEQDWLGESHLALFSVIMVDVWHWTSYCFLLLLAGLESLPTDVYEASKIDGAGVFEELIYITIPMMWPVIAVTAVTRFLLAFKVFDEVYLLTGGGPGTATEVLGFVVFRTFFGEDRQGFGSAMSISVIGMVLVMLLVGYGGVRRRMARS